MEYVETEGSIERKYSVVFNEEELKELLDEIIDKVSFKYSGRTSCFSSELRKTKDGVYYMPEKLPNGKPKYDNIRDVSYFQSEGYLSYHNDCVSFYTDETTPPKLAYIIGKIINKDKSGIKEFLDYPESDELISIDQKIEEAYNKAKAIDDSDTEEKIDALDDLKYLKLVKENHNYYDSDLLRQYYDRANELIGIQLVSETKHVESNKVLLKSFFETHTNIKSER